MAVPLVQMQSSGGTTILEPSVGELYYRHQLPQGPGGTRGCSPEVEALWESHRDALADSFVVTKPAWRTAVIKFRLLKVSGVKTVAHFVVDVGNGNG